MSIICKISGKGSYVLGEPIVFNFTISNHDEQDYYVLNWNTPLDGLIGDFLSIQREGRRLVYDGRLVKRGNPGEEDYTLLKSGEDMDMQLDITEAYNIVETGTYLIQVDTAVLDIVPRREGIILKDRKFSDFTNRKDIISEAVSFEVVSGREPKLTLAANLRRNVRETQRIDLELLNLIPKVASLPVIDGGTDNEKEQVRNAHDKALNIVLKCVNQLIAKPNAGNTVYDEWFGSYEMNRFNHVYKNYQDICSVLLRESVTYDLSKEGCGSSVYAYTYKGTRKIWLCNLFWSAGTTGYDSKFGTIIHELSHAVCSTDDKVYGTGAARELADTKPTKAIHNADNHEYFAETLAGLFGNVSGLRVFVGNFTGSPTDDLLIYFPSDGNWWLGKFSGNTISWSLAGNTAGFGQLDDGRPIWVGNFTGDATTDILFYYPGDHNWWLGKFINNKIEWTLAGNSAGFGQVWDGRPIWVGNFSDDNTDDVLFYFPGDHNWWLGRFINNKLEWSLTTNTAGFGNLADGRPLWVGNFTGSNKQDLLFYFPGDQNWWLGKFVNNQMQWSLAGNTSNFGQISDGRPIWVGQFTGDKTTDILFYFPSDHNWWLGKFVDNQLHWNFAGNTSGFGNLADGRPIWIGYFSGDNTTDILFYYPGDQNWWLGKLVNNQLEWNFASNTNGFGQVWDGRPFFEGKFSNDNTSDILFYYPGDDNWWLGRFENNQMVWTLAANTANQPA